MIPSFRDSIVHSEGAGASQYATQSYFGNRIKDHTTIAERGAKRATFLSCCHIDQSTKSVHTS